MPAAVTVYDKVDALRVAPAWNMARIGGVVFPKQFAAFDAWAYNNGADKKPNTADDLKLDAVDVAWSVEEYKATFDDDDIKFVGAIDAASGLFTPNVDGPNPQRKGERNNIGDVWVVASYTPPGAAAPMQGALAPAGRAAALHQVRSHGHAMSTTTGSRRSASASSIRSRPRASASSTWCRARPCSPSTTARRR